MDNIPSYLCRWNSPGPNRLVAEVARQLRGRYIACSRRVVDEIERDGIPLLPEVELIPNWAGGPLGSDRSCRGSSGRLRIISAGRITPEKGVGVLIESARVLRDRGIESFEIDIFGRLLDHEYPALVHRYGLEGLVSFKGELPNAELVKRYADYDVFAFPTWEREPFGIAPLEAALRGCVPIISRLCGISEWLVDGVHCLKADRTPEAFADRLQSVIDHTVDLGPIAARARRVVCREFRIEAVMPRIEAILERASRESRTGAGSTEDFHRLAIIAERLARIIVQEGCAA
jgi:glycosyltransferase involved in cell wall biosynthesis